MPYRYLLAKTIADTKVEEITIPDCQGGVMESLIYPHWVALTQDTRKLFQIE